MDSHKEERLNSLIKEALGEVIRQEVEFAESVFVSVESVETSPDLSTAKIWIDVWPEEKGGAVLKKIIKNNSLVRQALARSINLRRVPKLFFVVDTEEIKDEAQRKKVEDILQDLKSGKGV